MPVTEGKYQCKLCDDVFEAKSDGFTKCKCEKSEIKPGQFSYTYKNGNKVNIIEQHTYYLENEFVKLPDDIQEILDEIKKIKTATGYKYYLHEMTDKGKNGERYLSQINLSYSEPVSDYSSEKNEIELTLYLDKKGYRGDENARFRLQRFLNMMKKIESGELQISNRSEMVEIADKEDIGYRGESTGDMNYTFYL